MPVYEALSARPPRREAPSVQLWTSPVPEQYASPHPGRASRPTPRRRPPGIAPTAMGGGTTYSERQGFVQDAEGLGSSLRWPQT